MTICVAAIAGGTCVYGASDRMITSFDIAYEPPAEGDLPLKAISLTSSIVAMIAGNDISLLTQLIYDLKFMILDRVKKEPDNWWTVSDVAHKYRELHTFKKNQTLECKILIPRGLSYETFISRQREMAPQFLSELLAEMSNFQFPPLSVIFAGVDPSGPHLYVVRNGDVACEDLVGFAAIGSGYWHAESQFMTQGHTTNSPIHRGVYLTYAAKRRAEVAPGVGKGTDMFTIGPALGSYGGIHLDVIKEFERTYDAARKSANKVWEEEENKIKILLEQRVQKAQEKAKEGKGQKPEDAGSDFTPS